MRSARVATGPATSEYKDVVVRGPRGEFDLAGHLILPGLINAHDHLELNLFPKLGRGIYPNAREWASDIYRPDESPVREHLAVPLPARLTWGGIKNLICGVTTVAHHNPWQEVFEDQFPVRVLNRYGWAHSLDFTPDLATRFEQTPEPWPFILHAAEGADARARAEIPRLDEIGLLTPRTVLVHVNAAGGHEWELLVARGCSVVWCPTSNIETYGHTLAPKNLRQVPAALGTDSAMTAGVDLNDEIQAALECGAEPDEIYRMVTFGAAGVLRVDPCCGDMVAVPDVGQRPDEAIFDLRPELVTVGGRVKLISERLGSLGEGFHPIEVEGRGSWLIDADMPELINQTAVLGSEIRLAGRLVTCPQ